MKVRPSSLAGVSRSTTLLGVFLIASAAILGVGAALLAARLTTTLRHQAVDGEVESAQLFASAVVSPLLVHGDRLATATPDNAGLQMHMPARVRSINAWTRDGTLAFTNVHTERIGRRLPMDDGLRGFFGNGSPSGELIDLRSDDDERATANARPGHPLLLDTYVPIRGSSGRLIGAYEVYVEADHVDAVIASGRRSIWLSIGAVFAALFAALALLVRGASSRLQTQADRLRRNAIELGESNSLLEQSALEMIATLNATVEAKDPYTAGHSQRVSDLSLRLGAELGLSSDQLDLLRVSALFHDVGKIAVPDAILTKPGPLTAEEFEAVKLHAGRGAEIVANLSRFQRGVDAIRHHHERWDGLGYPDGLRDGEIPLEASIIGLADAWDAMTTARPYSEPLTVAAALEEIIQGRGTRYRPDAVDALVRCVTEHEQASPRPAVRQAGDQRRQLIGTPAYELDPRPRGA